MLKIIAFLNRAFLPPSVEAIMESQAAVFDLSFFIFDDTKFALLRPNVVDMFCCLVFARRFPFLGMMLTLHYLERKLCLEANHVS